jgi:predicted enzyme related to lactoylglutathione lyase
MEGHMRYTTTRRPGLSYIPASDLSRARKFYEETIDLKAKEEYA